MASDNTPDIPAKFRPSGDGRFLYRFHGRDYLLTREQALRQVRLFRNWAITIAALVALAVGFVVALFLSVDELGAPWRALPNAVFLVLCLAGLLGFHWRTAGLLEGCDHRPVAKAEGMVARGLEWLEYSRSTYLGDNPPPLQLFVYFVASVAMFVAFMPTSWSPPAGHSGLELAVGAILGVIASSLWLCFSAVFFYAFYRAITRNGASASGPEGPPDS